VASLSELNRTYAPLLSHYKTNQLANETQRLVEQYSRVREVFVTVLEADNQRTKLVH